VGIADALVSSPPILILDEPTAGLDPNQIRDVRDLIRKLGEDRAVLVSTHILPEVEATCDRVLVIARGKLVAQGSIEEIRALRRGGGVRVTLRGDAGIASEAVARVESVRRVKRQAAPGGATLSIELKRDADAGRATEEIVAALVAVGAGVREVAPRLASLEQVFSELTGGEGEARAGAGEAEA